LSNAIIEKAVMSLIVKVLLIVKLSVVIFVDFRLLIVKLLTILPSKSTVMLD
jgi:hypothetical protein